MKKVSVVILNWNGRDLLRKYLPSVCRYSITEDSDVYVADNGSDDDSLDILETEFPQVRIIRLKENYGFAEGYNRAIRKITSPYVVLLNSDVEVTDGWLDPLIEFADENPDVAAIQPKILSLRDKEKFEHAGAAGGFIDKNGFPYCRGRIFSTLETDSGQYDSIIEIFWASGAAFFTRTDDYVAAGGLDPHFFAHMEEIDLCWRYLLMGKSIYCVPQSVLYHLGGATLDSDSPRKVYLNFRNNILMLYKNLPREKRGKIIFRRKILDGIAAINFFLTGKARNVMSIIDAHRDAAKMIDKYYKHSVDKSEKRDILSERGHDRKSILTDYYIKGKKHFSGLGHAGEEER